MLAGAVEGASSKIKAKALRAAAHLLEADADDLEWVDGGFQVKGVPEQRKSLADIAIMLHLFKHSFARGHRVGPGGEQGLRPPVHDDAERRPQGPRRLLPVHGPRLSHPRGRGRRRDGPGGVPRLRRRPRLRHAGQPALARRPHPGGTAQGIGTALYEEFVYDADGQLLTASYLDYLIPTAMEVPELAIGHVETPSPYTPHGIKGGGEGGRMMAPGGASTPP